MADKLMSILRHIQLCTFEINFM